MDRVCSGLPKWTVCRKGLHGRPVFRAQMDCAASGSDWFFVWGLSVAILFAIPQIQELLTELPGLSLAAPPCTYMGPLTARAAM